ncbi:MAG: phage tail protein [Flavobacteriales bacterium]
MDNFIGEIKIFSFGQIPKGWLACNGQLLSVNSYMPLFSLIGSTFGGDGKTTFALPDLRGRIVVGAGVSSSGTTYTQGKNGGAESVVLMANQIPPHNHNVQLQANVAQVRIKPPDTPKLMAEPAIPAVPGTVVNAFSNNPGVLTNLHPGSMDTTGNSAPHENRVPLMALNICIATTGLYPTRP